MLSAPKHGTAPRADQDHSTAALRGRLGAALAGVLAVAVAVLGLIPPASAVSPAAVAVQADVGPAIVGSAVVGDTLTVNPGTWEEGAELSYHWLADDVEIPEHVATSLTVSAEFTGQRLSVEIEGRIPGQEPVVRRSAPTAKVAQAGKPTLQGTIVVGRSIEVVPGSWTEGTAFSYEWLADGVPLTGETASTLAIGPALESTVISARVTGAKPEYETVTRSVTATVKPPRFGTVTISGDLVVGEKLTMSTSGWTPGSILTPSWYVDDVLIESTHRASLTLTEDMAGKKIHGRIVALKGGHMVVGASSAKTLPVMGWPAPKITGPLASGATVRADTTGWLPGTSFTYAWQSDGVTIKGATSAKLALTSTDEGHVITLSVTGRLDGYPARTNTSKPSGKVTFAPRPGVAGAPLRGETLSAYTGRSWDAAVTSQWYVDGMPVAGATTAEYVVSDEPLGSAITVRVTHVRPGYATAVLESDPLYVQNPTAPTISGSLGVGSTLTAVTSGWAPGTKFRYEWYENSIPIPDAFSSRLVLRTDQAGKRISVAVNGYLPDGISYERRSAATPRVLVTGTPKISGTPAPGGTLSVAPGTWTSATALRYQWFADGVAIPGAAKSALRLTSAQVGARVSVVVTGSRSGYATVTKTASVSSRIPNTATPAITGAAKTGSTLKAAPGVWTVGTSFTYQWYSNGVAIKGATKSTVKLTSAQKGKTITVKVTGRKSGYATVTRTSKATAKVS